MKGETGYFQVLTCKVVAEPSIGILFFVFHGVITSYIQFCVTENKARGKYNLLALEDKDTLLLFCKQKVGVGVG